MSSNEAKEEDSKIVTRKEQRREHKREYQWKFKLQQAWLLEEKSQHKIEERCFLQHIDEALSILISDVAKKAHRSLANVVRTLAMFITYLQKGYDVIMQRWSPHTRQIILLSIRHIQALDYNSWTPISLVVL